MAKGSKGDQVRRRASSATGWTDLERVFAVIIVILIVTTIVGFAWKKTSVRVEAIEQRFGEVDLISGSANLSSYHFDRELKADYQFTAKYDVLAISGVLHFKVWNTTTQRMLVTEMTASHASPHVVVPAEDAGVYRFEWWVTGGDGTTYVSINVLIEPTEKLVM